MVTTCACSPGRGEFFAHLCPGPTPGAYRVGYRGGDSTDEPCGCPCHREAAPKPEPPAPPAPVET